MAMIARRPPQNPTGIQEIWNIQLSPGSEQLKRPVRWNQMRLAGFPWFASSLRVAFAILPPDLSPDLIFLRGSGAARPSSR
jgi:hypothetical protein